MDLAKLLSISRMSQQYPPEPDSIIEAVEFLFLLYNIILIFNTVEVQKDLVDVICVS